MRDVNASVNGTPRDSPKRRRQQEIDHGFGHGFAEANRLLGDGLRRRKRAS
jgi:hypothetical protein